MKLRGFLRDAHTRRTRMMDPEGGFAMLITLFLILIIAGISVLVAGLVLSENKPTQTARKSVLTLNASEAGFEVALHKLRSATDTHGNGIPSLLTCTTATSPGTPITGSVGPKTGAAGNQTLSYTVYVRYYSTDPSTMGTSDRDSNAIPCSGGAPSIVPQYAYLTSDGQGTGGANAQTTANNRTLHTTYRFRTSNLNISGGRLNMNTTTFCMDAGTSPAVGTNVTITQCLNRGASQAQSWAYRPDLTIYYTGSGSAPGLCLTGPTSSNYGTGSTSRLTLQACATNGTDSTYPYQASPSLQQQQEWSFDDSGKFEGAGNGGDVNGYCISAAPTYNAPAVGNYLVEQACSGGSFDTMTWNPDTQVGAGPAGDNTNQLVNYYEFGRCLDVTDQNVNATWLIDYPCKQAPNPANIRWNQQWGYNSTNKTFSSSTPSGLYCLTAPTTVTTIAANNVVLVSPCNGSALQQWTKKGAVTGDYGSSYTILSTQGACMGLAAGKGDTYHQQFSSIIVTSCDGSLNQKWNAPANFIDSRFKGTAEDQGGQ